MRSGGRRAAGRSGDFYPGTMSAIGSRIAPRRVGHKGAAHLAPGNTLASFEAAVRAGVDMIEFDVLSERPDGSGRLLLAHDYGALAGAQAPPLTLEEGLEHLASEAYAGIELDVDVKLPGYGARVIRALCDSGLVERALVSSTFPEDLDAMRAIEPALRVGWSVPRARRDYTEHPLTAIPALAMLSGLRVWLPVRARRAARGTFRRDHGALAHRHLRAGSRRRSGWRRALCLDRRRRRGDDAYDSARGRRDHHQRPPPVLGRHRGGSVRVAALSTAASRRHDGEPRR
jgi:glycerophosphoryl diester phosphodiesterase